MLFDLDVRGARALTELDLDIDPSYRNHFYVNYEWTPMAAVRTIPRGPSRPEWFLSRPNEAPQRIEPRDLPSRVPPPPNSSIRGWTEDDGYTLLVPRGPDQVTVRCRVDGVTREAVIWFGHASLALRTSGALESASLRRVIPDRLHELWGVVPSSWTPNLGPVCFLSEGSERSTRYGYAVEAVGTIRPPEMPCRFYIARRIAHWWVSGVDSVGRPLPADRAQGFGSTPTGGEDSTPLTSQTLYPENGRVYDYDCSGGSFNASNVAGDRHIWNVTFEVIVGIGGPRNPRDWDGEPGIWRRTEQGGRGLSEIQRVSHRLTWKVIEGGWQPTITSMDADAHR